LADRLDNGQPSAHAEHVLDWSTLAGGAHRVVAAVLEDPANRLTRTVEQLTGRPAASVEAFVAAHAGWFI
jgi:hypothetical protein